MDGHGVHSDDAHDAFGGGWSADLEADLREHEQEHERLRPIVDLQIAANGGKAPLSDEWGRLYWLQERIQHLHRVRRASE